MSLVWAITILDAASGAEMPTLVRDLNPYGAYPAEITVVGEKVFFASADGEHGDELWCYDGTRSARVADLQEGPGDFQPADLVVLGSRVYFHGGVTGRERELWTSDGTTVGTRLVTAWEGEATRIVSMRSNGRLLFLCVNSPASGGTPFQLWVSDGTAAGTRQVPVDGVDSFEVIAPTFVGDKCYFTSGIGCKLWVTDGSAANTHELAASSNPGRGDLVRTTNGLVFFAWDELWVSDGTSAGTRPLEVNPGAAGSFPFNLIPLGEKVVFFADDGSHGFEPWITDGTAAGTRLLRDVAAGSSSGISPNSYFIDATLTVRDTVPDLIGSAGSRAYFSNSSESEGWELWSTDGSGEGTVRVVDLLPGAAGSARSGSLRWATVSCLSRRARAARAGNSGSAMVRLPAPGFWRILPPAQRRAGPRGSCLTATAWSFARMTATEPSCGSRMALRLAPGCWITDSATPMAAATPA